MPTDAKNNMIIDPLAFRNALGSFVTGVTIVTTCDEHGAPIGLTANSFNSVSIDPPMILWSLGLNSGSLPAFRHAPWWAVHILSSDQEALSSRFAKRGADKFAGLETQKGPAGIPLIDGCAARFVCRTAFEYEGGDHAIFVGEVVEFERFARTPLAFHQGKYTRVVELPPGFENQPVGDEVEYGRHFLGHYLGRAHNAVFRDVKQEYRKRHLRGAEYTALTTLGLDDDCEMSALLQRAAKGGYEVQRGVVDGLCQRGLLAQSDGRVRLTVEGRRTLVELVAVAQAMQAKIQASLTPVEFALLKPLLQRVIDAATAEPLAPGTPLNQPGK